MAKGISTKQIAIGAGIVGVGAATWYILKKKDEPSLPPMDLPDLELPVSPYGSGAQEWAPQPTTPLQPQPRQYEPPAPKTAQPDDQSGMGEPKPRTVTQAVADTEAEIVNQVQQDVAAEQQQTKAEQRAALIKATQERLQAAKGYLLKKKWIVSPIQDASKMGPIDESKYGTHASEIFNAFGVDPGMANPPINVELGAHRGTGALVAALSDNTGLTNFSVLLAKPTVIVPEYAPAPASRAAAQGTVSNTTTQAASTPTTSATRMSVAEATKSIPVTGPTRTAIPKAVIMPDSTVTPASPVTPTTAPTTSRVAVPQTETATQTDLQRMSKDATVEPSASVAQKTPQQVIREVFAQYRSIGLCPDTNPPWNRIGRISAAEVAAEYAKVMTIFNRYNLGPQWLLATGGIDRDKANVRYVFTLKADPKYKVVLKRC